jgi:hypothetical protein
MSAEVHTEIMALAEAARAARGELVALAQEAAARRSDGGDGELAAALSENARALRQNTLELRALPAALERKLGGLSGGLVIGD